uniref:C-type lectin domain-containing protein n=1 Tax=Amphiprion percula TaxID=161767 RepID=A0A3P8RUT8_AMPPE
MEICLEEKGRPLTQRTPKLPNHQARQWYYYALGLFCYWFGSEPNNFGSRDEDCVELGVYGTEMNWNDAPCRFKNFWICNRHSCPGKASDT